MTIRVLCRNGHALAVEDRFAGRVGRCPKCRVEVEVPVPAGALSDDAILELVGPARVPAGVPKAPRPGVSAAETEPSRDEPALPGQDEVPRRMKTCRNCKKETPETYHVCPFCRTYFPLRNLEEVSGLSGRETHVCRCCGAKSFPGDHVCRSCGVQLLRT